MVPHTTRPASVNRQVRVLSGVDYSQACNQARIAGSTGTPGFIVEVMVTFVM